MDKSEGGEEKKNIFLILVVPFLILLLILFSLSISATPLGFSDVNITSNETGDVITSGNMVNISGGYISTLNLTTTTQNPHWKAFVGWINGAFTLDDSSGSTIYDWSLTTVDGEVYATRDSGSIEWTSIGCATIPQIESENVALSHSNSEDNITATFSDSTHQTFIVAGTAITSNSCPTLNTYVDNSTQDNYFEEMVLYDATSIIYATILEDQQSGFDENNYDFQMLVPENGSDGFSGATAYYLYVEIS